MKSVYNLSKLECRSFPNEAPDENPAGRYLVCRLAENPAKLGPESRLIETVR